MKYGDGRRLKVYSLEGDPEAIIEAARSFLDPNLPVITQLRRSSKYDILAIDEERK